MASQWTVLHFPTSTSLIGSDAGLAYWETPVGPGILIPTGRHLALLLTYCERRPISVLSGESWSTTLDHVSLGEADAAAARAAIAAFAREFVFGPEESYLNGSLSETGGDIQLPAAIVTEHLCDLRCHIYDYSRAACRVSADPDRAEEAMARVDWDVLPMSLITPVAVEMVFAERTRGGVYVLDHELFIDLRFGMLMREIRTSVRDFRRGGYEVVPVEALRARNEVLGEQWKLGRDGSIFRTRVSVGGVGEEAVVDLNLVRSDLGLP